VLHGARAIEANEAIQAIDAIEVLRALMDQAIASKLSFSSSGAWDEHFFKRQRRLRRC
jgi:hypothetical protein